MGDSDAPETIIEEEPAALHEPPPRPRGGSKPRRIALPAGSPEVPGSINLQFVKESEPPPAPPKKKDSPWEEIRTLSREEQERRLSKLADTDRWVVKRVGPVVWRGKRVPLGTYADNELRGPCTLEVIKSLLGGGEYMISLDDPTSSRATWIGPFPILGAPQFDVGVVEESDGGRVPADFRASTLMGGEPTEDPDDEWVVVWDAPRGQYIKLRKSDVERGHHGRADDRPSVDPALQMRLEAMERRAEETTKALQTLVQSIAAQAAQPREDPMLKFVEMERQRLAAEKEAKAEELRYLREKLDADAKEAERRRAHEAELAERRAESDRKRAEEERKAVEARADADRKAAEAKLEAEKERLAQEKELAEKRLEELTRASEKKLDKANEMVLELLTKDRNPLDNFTSVLSTVRELSEAMGGGAAAPPAEGESKNAFEKTLDKFVAGASRVWPAIEPGVREWARRTLAEGAAAGQPAPKQIAPTKSAQKPRPPAAAAPAAPAARPVADPVGAIVAEVNSAIDRGLPPRIAWEQVQEAAPLLAAQLKAYDTPDKMASDLAAMADQAEFSQHADALRSLAKKVGGPAKAWAGEFLAAVRAEEAAPGDAAADTGGVEVQ